MLSIRWRPSGGRGEYEYIAKNLNVLGKRIDIVVPGIESIIATDVSFRIKDGKPRLRREKPNDRSLLNVPPLVAAIAALPTPRREDQEGKVSFPLSDKSYVVDEVLFEVVHQDETRIVAKPVLLKPRNSDSYIDIEARVEDMLAHAGHPAVDRWIGSIGAGVNSAEVLVEAATQLHEALPYLDSETAPETFDPESAAADSADQIIEEYVGTEGKVKIRIHRHKERDAKLVKLAKKKFRLTYGKLFCECCGIDFEDTYGPLGSEFMEAHHRVPLSTIEENVATTVDDLAMLCANCHRMVHRLKSCSIEDLRQILKDRGRISHQANLALIVLE
ncbi:HNH endonuclease [Pseudoxanthomonas sp. F11]|uniref:HNH endonuclease n=1 Tax=Pseudoxanthomonas sp. F11 TaxID=3126308 RepID=UPI00300D021C